MAKLPSADGIQGVEDRDAGVGTPETEAEEEDDEPASEPGGGTQDVDDDPTSLPDDETSTVVFEEDTDSTPEPSDVKGVVTDDETEQRVQDFAEQQVRQSQQTKDTTSQATPQSITKPSQSAELITRSIQSPLSRSRAGQRAIQKQFKQNRQEIREQQELRPTTFDGKGSFDRDLRTLREAAQQTDNPFAKSILRTGSTFSSELDQLGGLVQAPFTEPQESLDTATTVASNPVQTADAVSDSFKELGKRFDQPGGGGAFAGIVAADAIADVPVGTIGADLVQRGAGAVKRGATRLRPDFQGVKQLDSGAEVIDVDNAKLRDDVDRIELVESGGAQNVDAQQAADEGLGVEAQQGAFARDFSDQLTIARQRGGEQATFGTAQTGLFNDNTLIDRATGDVDQDLRSPDTIEEAREIAQDLPNSDGPREALFFASPPTKQGNVPLRKSRLKPEQRESGIFSIPTGSESKQAQAVLVEGELKDVFDEKPELRQLAQRAEQGDAQAQQEFANELLELQFSKDKEFTPFGFVGSPESEVTTNAPVLFQEEKLGKTIVDGQTVDIVRANLGKQDDLPQSVQDDLADADTIDDAEKVLDQADDVVGSSRTAPDTRFSGTKASSQLSAGFAEGTTVPFEATTDTLETSSDVFNTDSSTPSIDTPSAPSSLSDVDTSSPLSGSTSTTTSTTSDTSTGLSGSSTSGGGSGGTSSPPSTTSTPGGGSSGLGGGSSGSGGGSGSNPPGTPPRRRRDNDDDNRPDNFEGLIKAEDEFVSVGQFDNKQNALQAAKNVAQTTSAMTFKVETPSGEDVDFTNVNNARPSRTFDNAFVEQRQDAINTPVEREQITKEALQKQRRDSNGFFDDRATPGVGFEETQQRNREPSPLQEVQGQDNDDFTIPGLEDNTNSPDISDLVNNPLN